jgi:hypothetical protein
LDFQFQELLGPQAVESTAVGKLKQKNSGVSRCFLRRNVHEFNRVKEKMRKESKARCACTLLSSEYALKDGSG